MYRVTFLTPHTHSCEHVRNVCPQSLLSVALFVYCIKVVSLYTVNDICTEWKFVHDARFIFDYKNITEENSIDLFYFTNLNENDNKFNSFIQIIYKICMYVYLYKAIYHLELWVRIKAASC